MPSNSISFPVYTTIVYLIVISFDVSFLSLNMSTILALLSYALLLPRAIVLRAIVLCAFLTARFCLRAFVGAVMSCALLSGHPGLSSQPTAIHHPAGGFV